jgi:hypothetical protein
MGVTVGASVLVDGNVALGAIDVAVGAGVLVDGGAKVTVAMRVVVGLAVANAV